jgi:L-lactate dehydrogenase complex protein LldG
MNAAEFLARIAQRLGRATPTTLPLRSVRGSPAFHHEPLAGDLAERFTAELVRVGGFVHRARRPAIESTLLALLDQLQAQTLVAYAPDEFAGFGLARLWHRPHLATPTSADFRNHAAQADVGITTVDAAIAETGTLLLTTAPGRPRVTSLLPTTHIALVRVGQLVPRLLDAWTLLGALPSAALFVTGPSRTSDIENDLTIGVHGPAAVHVILGDET